MCRNPNRSRLAAVMLAIASPTCYVSVLWAQTSSQSSEVAARRLQADLCVKDGRLEEAIAAYNRLVELRPKDSPLLLQRGLLYVRLGLWKDAAVDYTKAAELEPNDSKIWFQVAPLLILAGDQKSYVQHCQRMLQRFGSSDSAFHVDRTVKACLLLPDAVDLPRLPLETLNTVLDDRLAPKWFYGWGFGTRALAAYRAGDAVKAVHWVSKCRKTERYSQIPELQVKALLVLAMAHHQLEQSDDAQRAFAQADQLIDEYLPDVASGKLGNVVWSGWLVGDILRREAKELIDKSVAGTIHVKK